MKTMIDSNAAPVRSNDKIPSPSAVHQVGGRDTIVMVRSIIAANPWRMAAIAGLLLIAGLAEGAGLVTLLPILQIANGHALGQAGNVSRTFAAAFESIGIEPELWILLLIVVAAVFVKAGLTLLAQRNVGYAAADFATDLRLALIQNLMGARWSHFVTQASGRLANAFATEAWQSTTAYNSLANLIAAVIQVAVFCVIALFVVSWQVTVVGLIAGFAMMVMLRRLIDLSRRAGRNQVSLLNGLVSRLVDGLQLIKPLKAMGLEDRLEPLLKAETREINAAQRQQMISNAALSAFQEPLFTIFLAVGAFFALTYAALPFTRLLFMAILFQRIVVRTGGLQVQYQKLAGVESAYLSVKGAIERAAAAREDLAGGGLAPHLQRSIRLEDVSFGYDGKAVLRNVSLELPACQVTAIVGPSGGGKTTLADLVIGLIQPQSGRITVDDIALETLDRRLWRKMIGYVPQEAVLLHDTIEANVTLGDAQIGRAQVEAALHAAGLGEFVAGLPEGLETMVGERGARLSGGQRQRIAIARALARNPALLILDEPTTALDPETERGICRTIHELSQYTTVLAISHQTAIVEAAHAVYRLEQGCIAREPEPAPLMKRQNKTN